MKSQTFYKKLIKLFLTVGILPTVILGLTTIFLSRDMTESKLIHETSKANQSCISSIEALIDSCVLSVYNLENTGITKELFIPEKFTLPQTQLFYEKAYSTASDLYDQLSDSSSEEGRSVLKRNNINIHLINTDTSQILSLHDTPSVYNLGTSANWGFYRVAKESSEPIVYFSKYSGPSNTEYIGTVVKAYYENNALQGYLAIDIPLDLLEEQTADSNDAISIQFSLITGQDYILWDNNKLEHTANFLSGNILPNNIEDHSIVRRDSGRFLFVSEYSSKYDLYLLGGFNLELVMRSFTVILYIWIISMIFILFFSILTAYKITRTVTTPLHALTTSMAQLEKGNFDVKAEVHSHDEFEYVANQFNIMCCKIKELFQKNQEKQALLRAAELQHLQAQINPHFLYNTLDSIKYLAKMNGEEEIFIMTKSLNSLLKNSFRISKEFVTLEDSLKDLSNYIAIQQIRFPGKFDYHLEIPDELLSCILPNLILQPIVENAILHGLEPIPGRGILNIQATVDGDDLSLIVSDDGIGMSEEKLSILKSSIDSPDSSSHIGLRNVHQRLRLYYGPGYGLKIQSILNRGTIITIKLSYRKEVLS